ncbi:DUF3159 domain-containing protein [Sciscionella sediminilitoris]|uniref:DUF3159 domain-containing protein n=1 Tax=Sciscionella sediminilitoris TaxID=1445613 RepID=UPI0004DF1393|nr:DUF3159 domain-containing protein [Sciscionella sp. SE31]
MDRTEQRRESFASLLGGRTAAIDASLPPVGFVIGWLASGQSIEIGAASAIGLALVIAVLRLIRKEKPRAVIVSVALVVIAALIALHTGRAADFFLLQLLSNAASALAWLASIVVRWPFLGIIVGVVLGQKTRWRKDPALVRAYCLASLVWVAQYLLRIAVYVPLWLADETVALGIARLALSWPVQVVCLAVSWLVFQRVLPREHPGIRHPVTG